MTEKYKKTAQEIIEKIAKLRKELFEISHEVFHLEEDLERFRNETLKAIDENVKERFELKKDILK